MPFQWNSTLGGILLGEQGITMLMFPQNLSRHIKLIFCLLSIEDFYISSYLGRDFTLVI